MDDRRYQTYYLPCFEVDKKAPPIRCPARTKFCLTFMYSWYQKGFRLEIPASSVENCIYEEKHGSPWWKLSSNCTMISLLGFKGLHYMHKSRIDEASDTCSDLSNSSNKELLIGGKSKGSIHSVQKADSWSWLHTIKINCLEWNKKKTKQLLSPLRKWSYCFLWYDGTVSWNLVMFPWREKVLRYSLWDY